MNGQIISGTSICVDYWNWAPKEKYVRFLSHLHADHTYKLSSTFRELIYTSEFNAWLVKKWFGIKPELVVGLKMGEAHVILDQGKNEIFCVTLLDACHCPGSVMFLFQGQSFGSILYTGDFRYSPSMLKHPMLKSIVENELLNKLYFDNTFAAEHCEFPSRQEALKEVLTLVRNHPEHYILIGVRKLGKEEVLQAIALDLKEKILVSQERMEILSYLQYKNVFTTDTNESRILVKEIHKISASYIHRLQEEKGPVLTIVLTALYNVIPLHERYSRKQEDKLLGIHRIPYSDHSCHSELAEFISKLKPETIHPIVAVNHRNQESPSQNKQDLIGFVPMSCCWHNSVIPPSILRLCRNPEACASLQEEVRSSTEYIVEGNIDFVANQVSEDNTRSSSVKNDNNQKENESNAGDLEVVTLPERNVGLKLSSRNAGECNESDDWYTLSDEESSQKNGAENHPGLSSPENSMDGADLVSQVRLEVPKSAINTEVYKTKTTDEDPKEKQVELALSSKANKFSSEKLPQMQRTCIMNVNTPSPHENQNEQEESKSVNSKVELNKNNVECTKNCDHESSSSNSLKTKEIKCSTPFTSNKFLFFQELITEPTPIQKCSSVLPCNDKESGTIENRNCMTSEICNDNLNKSLTAQNASSERQMQFLSPDSEDFSNVFIENNSSPKESESTIPNNTSKFDENRLQKRRTSTNQLTSNLVAIPTHDLREAVSSFEELPGTSKPTTLVDSKENNKKAVNKLDSKNNLSETESTCSSEPENFNKRKNVCKFFYRPLKKIRITEDFKDLLAKPQINSDSDDFFKTNRHKRLPSSKSLLDERDSSNSSSSCSNDTLSIISSHEEQPKNIVNNRTSEPYIDITDPFFKNFEIVYSSWKESVKREISLNPVVIQNNNTGNHKCWDCYDWISTFERKGLSDK